MKNSDKIRTIASNMSLRLPILGTIKAGSPTQDDAFEDEPVSLDQYLIQSPGYSYLLRVSGDSNPNYPPLHPKNSLSIGGVVTSVIKKYY